MLTLNDGRSELWQWDTKRKLTVDADCSQVHFSNKVFGRSIDVDVVDRVVEIPDILLQTDRDLIAWAFVGTAENGYTKISKTFMVNRRNKPSDYVFTPVEQTTIAEIAAIAQSVRDDADAGLFDGSDGKTPVKGVDYGTPEEIAEISTHAVAQVQSQIDSLGADLHANAAADARTKRSLDALWKLNQGISYQFETDVTEAYSKTVPTGAKLANMKKIGGATFIENGTLLATPVNQVVQQGRNIIPYPYPGDIHGSGVSFAISDGGVVTANGTPTADQSYMVVAKDITLPEGDYRLTGCPSMGSTGYSIQAKVDGKWSISNYDYGSGVTIRVSQTIDLVVVQVKVGVTAENIVFRPMLVKGNSTLPYSPYHRTVMTIPEAVLALDGYGVGDGTIHNYIDFESKQYVKRCEITDGEVVELEEPAITDISELLNGTFQEPITVEAGGSLTFRNSNGDEYQVPVPSSVEYIVSLAEVNQ